MKAASDLQISPTGALDDVHAGIRIPTGPWWRRMLAFSGPAFLVSVGYMDPGNWATDIKGGTLFGYRLLWVLLMSNLIAILLQTLASRLGVASGKDLAQACRDAYSTPVRWALFVLCEIAIAACDLAEVLGTAIGINLLFGIPLLWGVLITGCDAFLLLAVQRWGMRKMEALVVSLISIIGACFIIEIFLSKPEWGGVLHGFVPSWLPGREGQNSMLYIAIGIIGATVMPHNLYLHSALVQSREVGRSPDKLRQALRFNWWDSLVALNLAFLVNAAILVVAAATFYRQITLRLGFHAGADIGIENAYRLLEGLLGTRVAPIAFGLALICAGQSSTVTGTLAGQITMEGFLRFRMRPWLRRLVTRLAAIVPAVLVIWLSKGKGTDDLLVLSQVILSLQLPFAVIPLVRFTGSRSKMGDFANPIWLKALAWGVAALIVALNGYLVYDQIVQWYQGAAASGWIVLATAVPLAIALGMLLVWLAVRPERLEPAAPTVLAESVADAVADAAAATQLKFGRIGLALDATDGDSAPLAEAISLARAHGAELVLLHVVEGVGGQWHGPRADDAEYRHDEQYLAGLAERLRRDLGVDPIPAIHTALGYGDVPRELVRLALEQRVDLLVMGGHGHRGLGDVIRGTTINRVRHGLNVPILAVRGEKQG